MHQFSSIRFKDHLSEVVSRIFRETLIPEWIWKSALTTMHRVLNCYAYVLEPASILWYKGTFSLSSLWTSLTFINSVHLEDWKINLVLHYYRSTRQLLHWMCPAQGPFCILTTDISSSQHRLFQGDEMSKYIGSVYSRDFLWRYPGNCVHISNMEKILHVNSV